MSCAHISTEGESPIEFTIISQGGKQTATILLECACVFAHNTERYDDDCEYEHSVCVQLRMTSMKLYGTGYWCVRY